MTAGFEMPTFTVWKVAYTAIGAAVFWSVRGRTELKPFGLSAVLRYLPLKRFHPMIEFILFIALGCFVGIAFADPGNSRQAITAGMGWTGVFVKRKSGA